MKFFIVFLLMLHLPLEAKVYSWPTTTKHIKHHTLMQSYPTTLYGGCLITKDWRVDLGSCNFYFRYPVKNTIDIEHLVPAERLRVYAGCGKLNRIKCRKVNKKFKACHNDRDNLFPVVSTINRYRGNMPFRELNNAETILPFGKSVGFRKSINSRTVEPPQRVKRLIGKVYLIMEQKGCLRLSDAERVDYEKWTDS